MNPASASAAERAAPAWRGEWLGGLNATAAMLPFVLTWGYIVFGSAGAAAAQIGLMASVLAVVIGPLAALCLSRAPLAAAAPSASTALILGTLVVRLLQDPALQPTSTAGAARLVACTAAAVVAAGVLLLALGAMRAGRLVRFVPQPVLAGFMNGVAVMIVLSQVPALLGLPVAAWTREGFGALAAWQGAPLAVAMATALWVGLLARWLPRAPAPMLALVLATLAVAAVEAAGITAPAGALERVGALAPDLPWPGALAPWFDAATTGVLDRHLSAIAVTALLLALIGALESVLNLAAVDQLQDARTDPDRELLALGAANIVIGLFGGLFLIYLRLRAVATFNGGGRTRHAVVAGCVLLALLFTLGLPLVQRVPVAVVAGIVVMLAWTLVDHWTRQLVQQWWRGERSRDLTLSLLVVAVVCAVTLGWGFVAGVAAGVVVSVAIFIRSLNRTLWRARYRASEIPSRRVYAHDVEATLAVLRERIEVFELEGALFFGNVEQLRVQAEAPAPRRAFLVLDLRRVSTVDASGAMGMAQLRERLARRGTSLLLAGVTPANRHGRALHSQGIAADAEHWHADADRAIEAAELALLAGAGCDMASLRVLPAQSALFEGLDAAQASRLQARMLPRELAAGERLFAQGDAGDALYLLARGSISVVDAARAQRFVSFSPGMCFGETAVLDGGGRTADALADVDSTVYALPRAALRELQAGDPGIAACVYRNLATHLSQRLRAAAQAWRHAAG